MNRLEQSAFSAILYSQAFFLHYFFQSLDLHAPIRVKKSREEMHIPCYYQEMGLQCRTVIRPYDVHHKRQANNQIPLNCVLHVFLHAQVELPYVSSKNVPNDLGMNLEKHQNSLVIPEHIVGREI